MAEINCIVSDGGRSKMNRSSSSSITYISGLSDDLLVEILCRLGSPKYATQCKCICKRWFSLINTNSSSGSYFLRCWHRINGKTNKEREVDEELPVAILAEFFICRGKEHQRTNYSFHRDQEIVQFDGSLDFLPIRHRTRCILATFRDVVLCCPSKKDHSVYYICNPFSRQWTTLPPPPPLPSSCSSLVTRVGLFVYEHEDYGFIFKVVRFTSTYSDRPQLTITHTVIVDTFSSDDSERVWRQTIDTETIEINKHVSRRRKIFVSQSETICSDCHMGPVSYNGMMVWLGEDVGCFTGIRINLIDPNVKGYFCIPLPLGYETPRGYEENRPRALIGVCKGCLRIAQLVNLLPKENDMNYGLKLLVWELDSRSQSSWELVHELDFSEMEDSTDSFFAKRSYQNESTARFESCVLAFHPYNGDVLYLFFVPPLTGSKSEVYSPVFVCNARERTLKVIGGLPVRTNSIGFPLPLLSWPTPVPTLSNPTSS